VLWTQEADALTITPPKKSPNAIAIVYKISF